MKYLKIILEEVIDFFVSMFITFVVYDIVLKIFGWAIPVPLLLLIMIIVGIIIDVEVE